MGSPAGGRKIHFLTFFSIKNDPKIDKNGLKMPKKRGPKTSKNGPKNDKKWHKPVQGGFFTF